MKLVAVSKASGVTYRNTVSASILKKRLRLKKGTLDKAGVKKLLDQDLAHIFSRDYKDEKDLILNSGFTTYIGSTKRLFDEIGSRKRSDFLLLTYLGKMRNALRTTYTSCDLSNLIFLNRLNRFALLLQELGGKPAKIMVAGENRTFDHDIFRFGSSRSAGIIRQARDLAGEFRMKNIEIRPLETFIGGRRYRNAFIESLGELRSQKKTRSSDEFKTLFKVFWNATSPPSLNEAVVAYTGSSRLAAKKRDAEESAFRYMAFQKARSETDFWGRNGRFMRSTVSTRDGVLTFKYEIGRLAPFQGMSIYNKKVGTEFLYDILCAVKGRDVTLNMLYYHGFPFLTDLRGSVADRAFASP
jgi:hypothetical protein